MHVFHCRVGPNPKVVKRAARQWIVEATAGREGMNTKYNVSFRTEDDMDRFLTDAVAMQELLQERRTQEKQHYGCNLQIGDTVTLAQPARELSGQASRQS